MNLVSLPMFLGSRNPLETLLTILDWLVLVFGRGGHFKVQNGRQAVIFAHILVPEPCRDMILMSLPMFSGSRNPLETLLEILDQLVSVFGRGGHFEVQNGLQAVTICPYISVSEPRRSMIPVSIPMFSGSRNPIRIFTTVLDHWVVSFGCGSHLEFQNGQPIVSICTYILVSETCRGKIMVSIPVFSGSTSRGRSYAMRKICPRRMGRSVMHIK